MWKPALDRAALTAPAPLLTFTGPTQVKQLRRQHRSRPPRRGYAAAGAAVVAAFGFLVWQVTNWTPADSRPQPLPLEQGTQAQVRTTVGCRVGYEISDSGDGRFAAAITVTNIDGSPIDAGWRLRLNLPDGQKLEPGQEAVWQQSGPGVASEPHPQPLAPGQSASLALAGTYAAPEGVPADFRLNEGPCAATVVRPSSAPVPMPVANTGGTGTSSGGSRGGHGDDGGNRAGPGKGNNGKGPNKGD
jgi:serine/threonine-protein kinase